MSRKSYLVLQMVILLLLNRTYVTKTQILGNIFRDPLNNIIKAFDGSYGSSSEFNRNTNTVNYQPLSYQQRFGNNDNYQTSSGNYQSGGGNCAGIWSYANDGSGHTIGLVNIQNPDRSKNVLKLVMSLSASLPSVIPIFL